MQAIAPELEKHFKISLFSLLLSKQTIGIKSHSYANCGKRIVSISHVESLDSDQHLSDYSSDLDQDDISTQKQIIINPMQKIETERTLVSRPKYESCLDVKHESHNLTSDIDAVSDFLKNLLKQAFQIHVQSWI